MSNCRLVTIDLIESPEFLRLSDTAQNVVFKLLLYADDFGRGNAESDCLPRKLWPLTEVDSAMMLQLIKEVGKSGIIGFYGSKDTPRYYYFPSWFAIQRFNERYQIKPTRIPNPPNPPSAYVDGSIKNCALMLKRRKHNPDEFVCVTDMLPDDWEERVAESMLKDYVPRRPAYG